MDSSESRIKNLLALIDNKNIRLADKSREIACLKEEVNLLHDEVDKLSTKRLAVAVVSLTADKKSLSDELSLEKQKYEDLQNEKKNYEMKIRRIATRSLALILTLCLALGLYVSSRFSDLEESFDNRLSEAEERIEEAESRATLAERRANMEKTRADDAETRLEEFLPPESDDDPSQADPNYTIALYTLRSAEKQGNLKEYLQYLESCGVDISLPPYSDFASAIELDEPPMQDAPLSTDGTTSTSSGGGSTVTGSATSSTIDAPTPNPPADQSTDVVISQDTIDRLSNLKETLEEKQKEFEENKKKLEEYLGGNSSGGADTTPVTPPPVQEPDPFDPAPPTSYTVYITESGTKYHSYGCRYLKDSCHPIDRNAAIANDYTPCSVCKP